MITDPVSLPERLADAEGELPEEIAEAIGNFSSAKRAEARAMAFAGEKEFASLINASEAAYNALAATILDRLNAAESAREAAVAERDAALQGSAEMLGLVRKHVVEAAKAEVNMDVAVAERNAALARAERAEKALKPFAEAADNLELLAKQDGSPPAVYKAVFWHSALVAARAALAHPAISQHED